MSETEPSAPDGRARSLPHQQCRRTTAHRSHAHINEGANGGCGLPEWCVGLTSDLPPVDSTEPSAPLPERREPQPQECHEVVTRKGEQEPCEKPAVALRLDPQDDKPYPVCKRHVRGDMVQLTSASDAVATLWQVDELRTNIAATEAALTEALSEVEGAVWRQEKAVERAEVAEASLREARRLLDTMDHFADVAVTCERRANESHERRLAAEAQVAKVLEAVEWADERLDVVSGFIARGVAATGSEIDGIRASLRARAALGSVGATEGEAGDGWVDVPSVMPCSTCGQPQAAHTPGQPCPALADDEGEAGRPEWEYLCGRCGWSTKDVRLEGHHCAPASPAAAEPEREDKCQYQNRDAERCGEPAVMMAAHHCGPFPSCGQHGDTPAGPAHCSSCGQSMNSPGCCTSPETKATRPQGFHTIAGNGGRPCTAEPTRADEGEAL